MVQWRKGLRLRRDDRWVRRGLPAYPRSRGRWPRTLAPGTTLFVIKVGQGPKGPQVSEVVSVDESRPSRNARAAAPAVVRAAASARRIRPFRRPSGPPVNAGPPEIAGTVKWYDPAKGFGFVMVEGEAKDLFVHRSALERGGLSSLAEGQAAAFPSSKAARAAKSATSRRPDVGASGDHCGRACARPGN